MPRSLSEIAAEIRKEWKQPYFGAAPYLDAMATMNSASEEYGADSGKSVVLYFLANASRFKGEAAKRIKLELKALVK